MKRRRTQGDPPSSPAPRDQAARGAVRMPSAVRQADPDLDLFRDAVKDAIPLATARRVEVMPPAPPPVAIQSLLDEQDAFDELRHPAVGGELALDIGEETSFVRDGYSPMLVRKLRRGQWVAEAELDLHGARREEAREMLGEFLKQAIRGRRHCVRIIHGKGLGSINREPVLKNKVKVWLARRAEVIAFCQAPPTLGGGGALLVLLKR